MVSSAGVLVSATGERSPAGMPETSWLRGDWSGMMSEEDPILEGGEIKDRN